MCQEGWAHTGGNTPSRAARVRARRAVRAGSVGLKTVQLCASRECGLVQAFSQQPARARGSGRDAKRRVGMLRDVRGRRGHGRVEAGQWGLRRGGGQFRVSPWRARGGNTVAERELFEVPFRYDCEHLDPPLDRTVRIDAYYNRGSPNVFYTPHLRKPLQ